MKKIVILITIILLAGCTKDHETNKISNYKQPPFYVQLTDTLTATASSQRISPLTASRIQAYTYLAAYLAYNETENKNKEAIAIKAASEIAKHLYYNVPVVVNNFNLLENKYRGDYLNSDIEKTIQLVKKISNEDKYEQSRNNDTPINKNKTPKKYQWEPTGIEPRSFMDPNFGDVNTLADIKNICKLPPIDIKIIDQETKEMYESLDLSKTIGLYVNVFLAGSGTPTPPGQNLKIITTATVENKIPKENAFKIITTSALAMFDTAILTWHEKKINYLARPETMIKNIYNYDVNLLRETPPHPSYPSGHSAFSGANVSVIENLISKDTKLQFSLPEDLVIAQQTLFFENPQDLSNKVNQSRVDALFHFPIDVKAGEDLGRCVGNYYSNNLNQIINNIKR